MKDITRRLNTLKIQERLRQMNLDKAEAQKNRPRSLGLTKRSHTMGSVDDPKQTSAAAGQSRTDRHDATSEVKDDSGTSSPNMVMNDSDKRQRRRRVNPAASMLGSNMFESNSVTQRDMITRSPSHPIPRPLGSPISSLHNKPTLSSAADQSPASETRERIRSLSRSPENRFSSGVMGERFATTGTGTATATAPSTSASSVYDGSVYTSGYGFSGTSRSSGSSSAFGAFELEDSVVYLAHPVSIAASFKLKKSLPVGQLTLVATCCIIQLGSSDPFARFWNMLEGALEQMTNPVAFASMPTDLPQVIDPIHETLGKKHRRKKHRDKAGGGKGKHAACDATSKRKDRDREHGKDHASGKGKSTEPLSDSSSGDSFCVISKESLRDDSSVHSGKSSAAPTSRTQSVSTLHASGHSSFASRTTINGKTPEELALENTNLRRSLDAMSLHSQGLERELERCKVDAERRQEMMRSVVLGVRREAKKAMVESQILGSMCLDGNEREHNGDRSGASSARLGSPLRHTVGLNEGDRSAPRQRVRTPLTYEYADEDPFAMDDNSDDDEPAENTTQAPVKMNDTNYQSDGGIDNVEVLRRRLQEVETENQGLKVENQRSRSHLQKYRDRFERMKVSSRAKKEAKLLTGGMQRASELPTLGEEGE
ncbi:hypothetical protein QFC22_000529 [Naganishia vaughanmartiniae]|uniref:Uncharacterized protein n=1 Tax=Naganishia vaughanmartiniae TaxID=1424756 RepID=A0ACC2XS85_9TREE|nr:hypothetical protein QFC22_000529 [Naganishia vaughanmartiniae]